MSETETKALAVSEPSVALMLQGVIDSGLTADNVQAFKELVQLHREEVASKNKAAFNRAFFALKKEISVWEFYADKQSKTKSGDVAYTYCSESEIAGKLEPLLFKHGFAMLFGQRQEADRVVAIITLIHENGHEETREYSVRTGITNAMKDATAADAGSTTTAWRHLVIKMFGLKSRIKEEDDARLIGAPITAGQAAELRDRVRVCGANEAAFLKFSGAATFEEIGTARLKALDQMLSRKERANKTDAEPERKEERDADGNFKF